jgi:hypothetical protein
MHVKVCCHGGSPAVGLADINIEDMAALGSVPRFRRQCGGSINNHRRDWLRLGQHRKVTGHQFSRVGQFGRGLRGGSDLGGARVQVSQAMPHHMINGMCILELNKINGSIDFFTPANRHGNRRQSVGIGRPIVEASNEG